jgi:hypothetical protein
LAAPDELAALQRRWEAADPEAARNADQVHHGRLILGGVAGLSTIWGLAMWGITDLDTAFLQLIVAAPFAVLFALSFRWPLFSIMGAAITYLCAWVLQTLLHPLMGVSFTLGKGLTLAGLIAGCVAEVRSRRWKRALSRESEPPTMAG